MGFFKKIGQGIKKFAKKNLNLKTLVKVGSIADPTGMLGNLQDAHYANKAAKEAEAEAQRDNGGYIASLTKPQAPATYIKQNPDIGDMLSGAAGGALTGLGNVLGGSATAGQAGASLADSTLSAWFQKNWAKVVVALAVLGGVIYFAVNRGNRSRRRRW